MKKEEIIRIYGEAEYEKRLQQRRDRYTLHREEENTRQKEWNRNHREEEKERNRLWRLNNPEKVKAVGRETGRKGGKYYEHQREYFSTGIQGKRNVIRATHRQRYSPYKQIIAPESQIHHEWIPNTSNYTGVALVEKDPHMHGFVDVIQILEGEITLLTEEEIKRG